MTTATLIGGAGFIGSALARHLEASGWTCWLAPREAAWPLTNRPLGHIFYCAGMTGDFLRRAPETVEAHVSLLSRVLQSTRWESLVYLSSTRLYDGLPNDGVACESALLPVGPHVRRHLFDLTKLAGESLCHAMGEGRARVARLSSVYDSPSDVAGFLPELIRKVAAAPRDTVVRVSSSGSSARDYVHLPDVLGSLVDIALRGKEIVYNVGSGENVSNEMLGRWVHEYAGRRLEFDADSPVLNPAQVDIARLRSEFGRSPAKVYDVIAPWLRHLGGQ